MRHLVRVQGIYQNNIDKAHMPPNRFEDTRHAGTYIGLKKKLIRAGSTCEWVLESEMHIRYELRTYLLEVTSNAPLTGHGLLSET